MLMALLSTGPIDNSIVLGSRPTKIITVKIVNRNSIENTSVVIQGFILDVFRTIYVNELLDIAPNGVLTKNYFADLDAFEFEFTTTETVKAKIGISVWGKQASGQLVNAHRVVAWEKEGKVF